MPHRPRPYKRTKRARKARNRILNLSCASSSEVQEETSDQIFDRLLDESRFDSTITSGTSQDQEDQFVGSSDSDHDSDYLSPLIIERCQDEDYSIAGRRVVNVNHVLKQLEKLASHPKVCTMGKYKFETELVSGLYSKWQYYCDNCEKRVTVTSEPEDSKEACNDGLVWGASSVGLGYSQVEELFAMMDIPIMGRPKFIAHEKRIGKVWEDTLFEKMKKNAEEEKRVAIEKGHILNGIPFITVIGDGGWAKRSYGHGMTSTQILLYKFNL